MQGSLQMDRTAETTLKQSVGLNPVKKWRNMKMKMEHSNV